MIHSDESYYPTSREGKHKIFIGMAPGVGKTCRMLEEAHQLKADGIDVVIGILETHGREETAQRSIGLERIPHKTLLWKGSSLTELDPEAVLNRNSQLVLIDELAHTNIPGSKREKRYQDVEYLLQQGINVYSTVNIQHLESLNDLVYRITGVVVRERIPDRLLHEADEVVVVDVTPEMLQERLQEGKIYAPEKIDQALQHFFQRQNLIALRELALRSVADSVEEYCEESNGSRSCTIQERILVCISTYPKSIQLLRRGARIANFMNGKFYVLFVSHPDRFLSKQETLYIETCKQLTQEFNGEFVRIESRHTLNTIVEVAQNYRITQIVLGGTRRSRWELMTKGSIMQKLMRSIPQVDLHVINLT
jgi:two-component system sensor histidine kinase KdpD